MASHSPPTTYLEFLDTVIHYALSKAAGSTISPLCLDAGLAVEVDHIIATVAFARTNKYSLPWDNRTYSAAVGGQIGKNLSKEDILRQQFTPLDLSLSDPALIDDAVGDIVALYLPDALLPDRQAKIAESMGTLAPTFAENWVKHRGTAADGTWRSAEHLFLASHQCKVFGRGNITASPAWHSQGQTGFGNALYVSSHLGPGPSGKRASNGQLAFQKFVRDHLETGCLMSVALALAHPEQYALTRACLGKQASLRHLCDYIRTWAFGFNVVTIVANREALTHRDMLSGGVEYLDELLSIGGDVNTVLELPGVGIRFLYTSGTLVLFSGHVHLHGVSHSETERVCFAAYARPSVHRVHRIHTPRSPTLPHPLQYLHWIDYIHDITEWAKS